MTMMTLEFAKAYGNERMAHAQMKRQQREAVLAHRTQRVVSGDHPIRVAIGNGLINIGEHLSKKPKPMPSTVIDVAIPDTG